MGFWCHIDIVIHGFHSIWSKQQSTLPPYLVVMCNPETSPLPCNGIPKLACCSCLQRLFSGISWLFPNSFFATHLPSFPSSANSLGPTYGRRRSPNWGTKMYFEKVLFPVYFGSLVSKRVWFLRGGTAQMAQLHFSVDSRTSVCRSPNRSPSIQLTLKQHHACKHKCWSKILKIATSNLGDRIQVKVPMEVGWEERLTRADQHCWVTRPHVLNFQTLDTFPDSISITQLQTTILWEDHQKNGNT